MFTVLHVLLILPLPVEAFVEVSNHFTVVLWDSISVSAVKPGLNVTSFLERKTKEAVWAAIERDREALGSIFGKQRNSSFHEQRSRLSAKRKNCSSLSKMQG